MSSQTKDVELVFQSDTPKGSNESKELEKEIDANFAMALASHSVTRAADVERALAENSYLSNSESGENKVNKDNTDNKEEDSGIDSNDDMLEIMLEQQMRNIKWTLGACGYDGKIINLGKTFRSDVSCIARTGGDLPMMKNTGVYKISFNIEKLVWPQQNGIGICTRYYQHLFAESQEQWHQGLYHIGWDFGGNTYNKKFAPNGLLCGWNFKKYNHFYNTVIFDKNKHLPSVHEKDIVSLIYDSIHQCLYFEKNGKQLHFKISNIPNGEPLYFFIGKKNYLVQGTILRINYLSKTAIQSKLQYKD